jgi:mono/diheme cytochrome c family protein
MRHVALAIACLAGPTVFGACDWSLHRMQERVTCTGLCDVEQPDGIVSTDPPTAQPALSRALIERGRDRFERICAPCHGVAGDGQSPVALAMAVRRPPPLVDAAAARLADDRILTVIATGYGLMPSYRVLVAPPDRYAILHYIRALQQRDVALDELSPSQRTEAERWLH